MKKFILGNIILLSMLLLSVQINAEEDNLVNNLSINQKTNSSMIRENSDDSNMTDIKLNNLIITSEYSLEEIDVDLIDGIDKVTANVYAKNSKDLLESFSEEKEPNNVMQSRAGTTTYNSTVSAKYRVGNNNSKIYVISYANVNISAGTGWAQINKKPSKIWQSPDSSGSWTLKNKNQSIRNTKFPTNNLGLNIQGLVEVSKSTSKSMGLSFNVIKGMGFDMSGTTNSNWYARKNYNSTVYIKTMW